MCLFVKIGIIQERLRDKKDNFLLALYHAGNASLLVSGDKMLLEEAAKENINVATFAEFKVYIEEPR
jgi:predicted nucleic acid-binding protein